MENDNGWDTSQMITAETNLGKLQTEIDKLRAENIRLHGKLVDIALEHPCYQLSKDLEQEVDTLKAKLSAAKKQNEILIEALDKVKNDLVFELGHQEWVIASDKHNLDIIKNVVEKKVTEISKVLSDICLL